MSNFNKVMLTGNLGADPEMRYPQGGTAVANFRIATTERWKDADGEMQERTDWHRIVVWGKQGETCRRTRHTCSRPRTTRGHDPR
ncbi:MAG: single-stranded DNA-binding protein [Deltaproteobacteria bacterium]|jgi:single-strand DNA-binding protein